MKNLLLIIALTFASSIGAVCLNTPGIHSPRLEQMVENAKACKVNSDCTVLGCFEAYNLRAAKFIGGNPDGWVTINCSKTVHDQFGVCLLSAMCENSICVIDDQKGKEQEANDIQ